MSSQTEAATSYEGCAAAAEPFRTPGSIQPHGFLLALDAATGILQHLNANVLSLLARPPESF